MGTAQFWAGDHSVGFYTRKYSIYGLCSRVGAVHGEWVSLHDELVCSASHAKAH